MVINAIDREFLYCLDLYNVLLTLETRATTLSARDFGLFERMSFACPHSQAGHRLLLYGEYLQALGLGLVLYTDEDLVCFIDPQSRPKDGLPDGGLVLAQRVVFGLSCRKIRKNIPRASVEGLEQALRAVHGELGPDCFAKPVGPESVSICRRMNEWIGYSLE